tara:strand:+ start:484 stop:864 length:381 start_codon:yes stop_codon:yes gene_type:complete
MDLDLNSDKKKKKRGDIANFKGIKSTGRPKGSKNLISKSLRKDMEAVYSKLGGAEGFYKWAKKNPSNMSLFYRMVVSMIPKTMNIEGHISHSLSKLSDEDLMTIIKKGEVLQASDIIEVNDIASSL